MSENTTSVEGLVFTAKDETSNVTDKIGKSFERLHHAAEGAREKVGEFAKSSATGALASIGLGFGLHALFDKAKEVNLEMAGLSKKIGGAQFAFRGWAPGLSTVDRMAFALKQGKEIGAELEKQAIKLRAPIADIGATYEQVAAIGFAKLGMSQKEVLGLTEEMTAAAKIYGTSGTEAIEKIHRVLLIGKVSSRDTSGFGEKLRESLHLKKGEHLGPEEMMARIRKGLGDIVPAAKMMGEGMAGSLVQAKQLVDSMVRDLSGPLFEEQSKSLSEWVQKLRTVKEDGKSLMQIYGEDIAGAFREIKSATGFIVDHWKSLLTIYAASKLSGVLGGFASKANPTGIVGGAMGGAGVMNVHAGVVNVGSELGKGIGSGISGAMTPGITGAMGKLAGMASKALMVTEGLTALYLAADKAADWFNDRHEKNIAESGKLDVATYEQLTTKTDKNTHAGKALAGYLQTSGLGDKAGVDQKSALSMFSAMDEATRMGWAQKLGAKISTGFMGGISGGFGTAAAQWNTDPEALAQLFGKSVGHTLAEEFPGMGTVLDTPRNMLTWGPGSPNVDRKVPKGHGDINIQNLTITQDFKEADPDRVFHRVTNDIASLANSPGKARTGASMPGGW
jgi:hypothetical protein